MENKWIEMRQRSIKLSESIIDNADDINVRIIKSQIVFKEPKTLLVGVRSGKSFTAKQNQYRNVSYVIMKFIEKKNCQLSTNDILGWFELQYNHIYGYDCIDYNRWNALNTFKNVMDVLHISEQELAYQLNKWMFTYYDLGLYRKSTEHFCLSILKRQWLVQTLYDDKQTSTKSYY